MRLRARVPVNAHFRRMAVTCTLPAGGPLQTETSARFHVKELFEELHRAGLDPTHAKTYLAGGFSVMLATMLADSVRR